MNTFKASLLATALIAGGALAPVKAADNMAFDVTISIAESCDVTSVDAIGFGNVLASAGTAAAQGDVTVQCTIGTDYNLALSPGIHSGNDINARQMQIAAGTDTIAYQLYQDDGAGAAGSIWGETAGTDTDTGIGTGFGTAAYDQIHTVHAVATIPGTAPAGNYSDTITATVTF